MLSFNVMCVVFVWCVMFVSVFWMMWNSVVVFVLVNVRLLVLMWCLILIL